MALSASLNDDASVDNVLTAGAKYNASLPAMELGFGGGYSQLALDVDEDAIGISLGADFNNGLRAILNWIDMGDAGSRDVGEHYIGVGPSATPWSTGLSRPTGARSRKLPQALRMIANRAASRSS